MASTITLQNSISFVQPFVRLMPMVGVGGVSSEPAITIANTVKQFILSAPFAWRWNRASKTFNTVGGTQDYTVSIPDFGWLEKASISNASGTWEIPIRNVIAPSSEQNRPSHIAPFTDDGAGNIVLRLLPVPDGIYTVTLIYQKKATLFTSLTSTWGPIPDEMAYLFNRGMLALALEQVGDDRYQMEQALFLRSVIAANDGLDEQQKNIFLADRLINTRQQQDVLLAGQQGRASRGM